MLTLSPTLTWAMVQAEAARRLAETDRYMQPDFPLTDACRLAMAAYRQDLRDLNRTFADPADVVFPSQPEIQKVRS